MIGDRCDNGEMPAGSCTSKEIAAFAATKAGTPVADPRVVAAIPLAGTYRDGWFGEQGYASVVGPVSSNTGGSPL